MQDLRIVEIQQRDGMAFGIKETVGTLVGGGILMMVGLYAYSKVGSKVDLLNGNSVINSSHYCLGTWNATGGVCDGVNTTLPIGYAEEAAAMANIKSNITSGFDLFSLVFIILAIVTFIGVLFIAFR